MLFSNDNYVYEVDSYIDIWHVFNEQLGKRRQKKSF